MNIIPRAEVRFAVSRAFGLDAKTEEEAFAVVAQSMGLTIETVEECWREVCKKEVA